MNDANESSELTQVSGNMRWKPTLATSLLACFLGVLVGAGVVHAVDPYFQFANLPELGISPSPELVAKHNKAQIAFWSNNLVPTLDLNGRDSLGLAGRFWALKRG